MEKVGRIDTDMNPEALLCQPLARFQPHRVHL